MNSKMIVSKKEMDHPKSSFPRKRESSMFDELMDRRSKQMCQEPDGMAAPKILFIEDDLPQAPEDNELWMLLLGNGYAVAPARTGAEAWQLLGKEKFDVVIADIMLSAGKSNANANLEGISRLDMGAYLIENIRSATFEPTGTGRDVPIVVVSAVVGKERWERIEKALGEQDIILKKPLAPQDIFEAVRDVLSERASQEALP